MTGLPATVALARLGDARVMPALARSIATVPYWPHTIVAGDVLAPLRDHAAHLVPAIRTVLRRAPLGTGQFLRALAAWAAASVEAMPELVALLDTAHAARSCVVLGRIGPDAGAAADVLEQLALGRRRPPPARDLHPAAVWHGTQDAAWAHWRVTGDPGLALAVLGRAVRRGLGTPAM